MKTFSVEDLAQFDGKDGRPAYVAYMGKVYDMTGTNESDHGDHFGHPFGVDLTVEMDEAPHDDNPLFDLPVVGIFQPVAKPR